MLPDAPQPQTPGSAPCGDHVRKVHYYNRYADFKSRVRLQKRFPPPCFLPRPRCRPPKPAERSEACPDGGPAVGRNAPAKRSEACPDGDHAVGRKPAERREAEKSRFAASTSCVVSLWVGGDVGGDGMRFLSTSVYSHEGAFFRRRPQKKVYGGAFFMAGTHRGGNLFAGHLFLWKWRLK